MPDRAAIGAVVVIILMCIVVKLIEVFVPISAAADFNATCRNALATIETKGSLTAADKTTLKTTLEGKGFTNVTITSTTTAKLGDDVNLSISADYTYSIMVGIFDRQDETKHLKYNKISKSRKVVN